VTILQINSEKEYKLFILFGWHYGLYFSVTDIFIFFGKQPTTISFLARGYPFSIGNSGQQT